METLLAAARSTRPLGGKRMDEELTYWRPQIMRHSHLDGRVEYAFHDVYFRGGKVISYTVHARSDRKATIEELEEWTRNKLPEAQRGLVCGDLGDTQHADDLDLWLVHMGDPPINYVPDQHTG